MSGDLRTQYLLYLVYFETAEKLALVLYILYITSLFDYITYNVAELCRSILFNDHVLMFDCLLLMSVVL